MTRNDTTQMLMSLSERDVAILASLRAHRLLRTAHVRRLHFGVGHATVGAATGAAMRVLTRLESHGLVSRLERRIGGVRAGSSGIVWQLGATGERLLRAMHGERRRRRYTEPSAAFTAHTLATADLAVTLREAADRHEIELLDLQTEPACWRSVVGPTGAVEWLKPDLYAVTATSDYEDHWFLEADLATEHPPVVVRKAKVYQRYAATGVYQTRHGLFPAVIWVVPDRARRDALQTALAADHTLQQELFSIVTAADVHALITEQPDSPVGDRSSTASPTGADSASGSAQ